MWTHLNLLRKNARPRNSRSRPTQFRNNNRVIRAEVQLAKGVGSGLARFAFGLCLVATLQTVDAYAHSVSAGDVIAILEKQDQRQPP